MPAFPTVGTYPLTGVAKLPNVTVAHPGEFWTNRLASGSIEPGVAVVPVNLAGKLAVRVATNSDPILQMGIAIRPIDQHVDELALNFWGPIEKLRSQANEKLRQLPTTRLVELIQAAITSGVYYGTFAATTLTGAQVRSVVEQVSAKSGGSATIIGTELGVRYLSRVGLEYSDEARNQILHTGMIGVFEGWPVAQIENFEDFAGNFVLPNNELWIVGKKAGRLTYYGGVKGQVLSMTAFRRRWETARDAGMLLYGADERHGRLGRIVLT
jgi:hypothetical protein